MTSPSTLSALVSSLGILNDGVRSDYWTKGQYTGRPLAPAGPCTHTGASMKDAHKGMKITDAEFNALVEDLVKSLDKFKNDLLGALGGMKPDIVNQ
jgi:hypothetical protein